MSDLLEKMGLIIPLPIVGLIIMYTVDHWNSTELERKLMTNFRKLKINISVSLFISIIGTLFVSGYIFWRHSEVSLVDILATFILLAILTVITTALVFSMLKLLTFKTTFYTYLTKEKNEERWVIVKVIKGKELLLERESDKMQIVTSWSDKLIERDSKPLWEWQYNLYDNKKVFCAVLSLFIIMFLACFGLTLFYFESSNWIISSFAFLLILLCLILSLSTNLLLYKRS